MIRTGSIGLDIALKGGWPDGTLNEIWGDTGAGKTVLALHTVENMTRAGKHTVWIDTVDGVAQMDSAPQVIVCRPRYAEDVFMVTNAACAEKDIGLVVIDSANMLVRERELNDPTYVPHPQREYKTELALLKAEARDSRTTVLFVSQPRDKEREPIRGTGISEKVKYRVHLHPDVVHQDGSREIQATVKDVPGKKVIHDAARFTVRPGQGIDRARELVEIGIHLGVVIRRGSWVAWNNLQEQGVPGLARRVYFHGMHDLENEIRACAGIA
jgi:recombination protein RecA